MFEVKNIVLRLTVEQLEILVTLVKRDLKNMEDYKSEYKRMYKDHELSPLFEKNISDAKEILRQLLENHQPSEFITEKHDS